MNHIERLRRGSSSPPPYRGGGRFILIGSSTGGVDALMKIISHFSKKCPPTLIVQHTGGVFAKSLIRLLDGATEANVGAATDGAELQVGNIYLAPNDTAHLCIAAGNTPRISLRNTTDRYGHRPSVNALFESAVPFARQVTAVILTGMGRDGATGMVALRKAGAQTFGQDEQTSVVYGMPKVAYDLGGVETQLPLSKIGPMLLQAASKGNLDDS